jgi:hypothetical protein
MGCACSTYEANDKYINFGGDADVGRIILKWILGSDRVDWTQMAQNRFQRLILVKRAS